MPRKRTGIIVIGVLLAASGLAFLRAEQLKLERAPVGGTHLQKYFSTTCSPVRARHPLPLALGPPAVPPAHARAGSPSPSSDGSGRIVAHLTPAAGRLLPRGPGQPALERPRRRRAHGGRGHLPPPRRRSCACTASITIPDPIELDNTAPRLTLLSRPGSLPISYRTSEPAVVFVRAIGLGADTGRSTVFHGRAGVAHFHHTGLTGAHVRITLLAVDPAGNASALVDAGSIRLPA